VKAFTPKFAAIAVCLAVTMGIAHAAVYKYIDENGNVAYGDKPIDGSEKVKIHGVRSTSEDSDDEESDEETTGGSRSGNAVVDERSGSVQVIFLPTPSLAQSDQLVVTVDGKDISKGRDANLALSNLTRGAHTVTGKIIDADGAFKDGATGFGQLQELVSRNPWGTITAATQKEIDDQIVTQSPFLIITLTKKQALALDDHRDIIRWTLVQSTTKTCQQ